jgi:Fic family protein
MDDQLNKLTAKKDRLDALRPLPPELIKNLDEWYKIELTYTSNAIEGNTLTRAETALVVEKGITVQGKTLVEHLEARNHAAAVDFINELAARTKPTDISEDTILDIHRHILKGIDDSNAGRYRSVPVRVQGSRTVFPNYMRVPDRMAEFIAELHEVAKTEHPVVVAAFAHFRLVSIHPFVDGNGRTSRLLMNLILGQTGYPPAIIQKEDRLKYINSLEDSRMTENPDLFYAVVGEAVDHSLDIYLDEDKTPVTADQKLLRIGDVARLTDEEVANIRFWTSQGLLQLADRSAGGYRLYEPEVVGRVKRIRELQQERLTLAEIKEKLDATK